MFSYYFIFKNKINDKKITFMERSYWSARNVFKHILVSQYPKIESSYYLLLLLFHFL